MSLIALLTVIGVVCIAAFFVKLQISNDKDNFEKVKSQVNGELEFKGQTSVSKYLSFLFPLETVFKCNYSDISFQISVHDSNQQYNAGRFFAVEAKPNFPLMCFRIIKKIGLFTLSASDQPISTYETKGIRVHGNPNVAKKQDNEINISGKTYYIESNHRDRVLGIINQHDLKTPLTFLLRRFKAVDCYSDGLKLKKRWSNSDTKPENLLKLLESTSTLVKSIKP